MRKNSNKIPLAVFDFCETLVDFQTADAFIDYVRANTQGRRKIIMSMLEINFAFFRKIKVVSLLEKITRHKYSISKRIKLLQLINFSYESLDKFAKVYYIDIIKPHLIPKLVSQMIRLQKEDFKIIIVSGGYDVYLKYFAKEYRIEDCLCTQIKFSKGKCKGMISGVDCMNENKILKIHKEFPPYKYNVEYAFSDSISDLPLLRISDNGVVVSHAISQKWAVNNNLKEIIW